MPSPRLRAAARRTLAVLQAEPGDGWIDLDRLIALAEIRTPDEDLDTRINAVSSVLDQLEAAGYHTEFSREAGGDFYRLARIKEGTQ